MLPTVRIRIAQSTIVRSRSEPRTSATSLTKSLAVEWAPDPDNVYLSSGIDNLALHRSAEASRSDPTGSASLQTSGALDHLGLIVHSADDVDRWAQFLESRGVTLKAKPRTHRDGARSMYFLDPDGNSIQIIHHPPISGK